MSPATPADDLGIPGVEDAVKVGSGGFATVYRARQPAFGRDVAVKVIDRRFDEQAITRFKRECLAIGQLGGHPAIVTVFEAGQTAQGRPYLLMPFHEAGSLQDRLDRGQPLTWEEACAVGIRLASALAEAHQAGVLHRDVKPANVLVSRYGEAVLTDFGIARVADGPETTSGNVTASLAHAAPEILNGARPTAAADLYSLGSTLYMLIAGRSAFHSGTDESVLPHMHRILTIDPPDLGPHVPHPVRRAIAWAMAKNPEDRPIDAVTFARQLQLAQDATGVPVTPLTFLSSDRLHADAPSAEGDGSGLGAPRATDAPAGAIVSGVTGPGDARVDDATVAVPPIRVLPDAAHGLGTGPQAGPHVPTVGTPDGQAPGPPVPDGPARTRRSLVLGGVGGLVAVALVAAAVLLWPAGGVAVPEGGPDVADLAPIHLPDGITIDQEVRGLQPNTPVDGTLEAGQAVAYRFEAPEVGWLGLRGEGGSGTIDPMLLLFDPDGSEITHDDDSAGGDEGHDAAITTTVDPFAGPYTVVVTSVAHDQGGEYRLALDVASVRELPTSDSDSFSGQLGEVPAVAYRFEAEAGDEITFVMRSESIDAYLELYSADGTQLSSDDDSGGGVQDTDAQLYYAFDNAGEHWLVALQFDPTVSGEWTLDVDR